MSRLFGTDGVRGVANRDLTGELAFALGRAAVVALTEEGAERPAVAIGRDTRASGEFLEATLAAGVCSAGGDPLLLGVATTPAVSFVTTDVGAAAGAVISASHNPAEYNGIKFFGPSGHKIPDSTEDHIEELLRVDERPRPTGRSVGRIHVVEDWSERYLSHLLATADGDLDGIRVVVDCANGAASALAPQLLRRLGADVIAMNDRPDGFNINEGGGATHPEAVALAVVDAEADAGVAHDGDADRAMFSSHLGEVVDGDNVLASCAIDMKDHGDLPGDLVVTTVMANQGFRLLMKEVGIRVAETRVGDRYVLEEMLASGAILGGEQSGHVIFLRHAPAGDGLLTAVQFLTLAKRTGAAVADLAARLRRLPQVLVNVEVADPSRLDGTEGIWSAVREAEAALGEEGRVLVRASGTEPLVRVMVEAPSVEEAEARAGAIAAAVRRELN